MSSASGQSDSTADTTISREGKEAKQIFFYWPTCGGYYTYKTKSGEIILCSMVAEYIEGKENPADYGTRAKDAAVLGIYSDAIWISTVKVPSDREENTPQWISITRMVPANGKCEGKR